MKPPLLLFVLALACASTAGAGELLTADAPVHVGDKFQAQFVSSWFEVEVTEVLDDGDVKISSINGGPFRDKVVAKTSLQRLPQSVQGDTPLLAGDKLQAHWGSRWHPVEVLEVLAGPKVKIRWLTFGPAWDQVVDKTTLRQMEGVPLKDPPPPKGEVPLGASATLKPGDKLRAKLGGVWGDVQVVESLSSGSIAIRWPAFEEHGRQIVARTSLYLPGLERKRTWTDVSGKFKIEAEFVALEEGKVRLVKSDGKATSLPLEKLSPEDQKAAQTLAQQAVALAAAAATAKAENPFGLGAAKPRVASPFSPAVPGANPGGGGLVGELLEKFQPAACVAFGKASADKSDWLLEKTFTLSQVNFPEAMPEAYSVEVKLRREEGADALVLVLPIGQRHANAHLNSYVDQGTYCGLETGPKLHAATSNAVKGLVLKNGQDYTLKCVVEPRHIVVELDGRKIADWEGDPATLSPSTPFLRPVRRQLGVASWQSQYRLMSVKVEALEQTGK